MKRLTGALTVTLSAAALLLIWREKNWKENRKSMETYKLKTPRGIERAVVELYKTIEHGVVGAYQKIESRFVDAFLERTARPRGEEKKKAF